MKTLVSAAIVENNTLLHALIVQGGKDKHLFSKKRG
jgi:hypothetical protein